MERGEWGGAASGASKQGTRERSTGERSTWGECVRDLGLGVVCGSVGGIVVLCVGTSVKVTKAGERVKRVGSTRGTGERNAFGNFVRGSGAYTFGRTFVEAAKGSGI